MTTLWLVRHGETNWNVEQRFQGSSNQALNPRGEEQASSLAPRLENASFDAIYSSDLIRVQRTAQLALNGNINSLILDARLQELHFGNWEGMKWSEAREADPEAYKLWEDDREQNPHGGERMSEVIARIGSFLEDIKSKHNKDEQVLIFAHGGTLAVMLCLLLGTDPNRWWQYRFLNCTLSEVLLLNRGAVLLRLNDASHLDE